MASFYDTARANPGSETTIGRSDADKILQITKSENKIQYTLTKRNLGGTKNELEKLKGTKERCERDHKDLIPTFEIEL